MQTFLPLPSFYESTRILDWKRLGNQRLEAKSVLYICKRWDGCDMADILGISRRQAEYLWKRYRNHPIILMWQGCEHTLARYGLIICEEWIAKGFVDNQRQYFLAALELLPKSGLPHWFGNEDFHKSHRSNLLRKLPSHYQKYWPSERDDLPYIWPASLS